MANKLKTDGYKFSMAQAGFPMRYETFYLSFRRGGWQYIPFDLKEHLTLLLPQGGTHVPHEKFATKHGYGLTDAMDVPLKNYSSGMIARLGFAVATEIAKAR